MLNPYHWSLPPHESRASSHINIMPLQFQLTHQFHMPRSLNHIYPIYNTDHTMPFNSQTSYLIQNTS